MASRSQRRLELHITGDARKAQKALADLDAAAGKHGKGTEDALSKVKGSLLDLGVAGAGLFAFNEWNEAEKVAAQTEAAIRSTGGAAGETVDEIGALSEAISEKTAVDDEMVQSAANVLIGLQDIRNEAGKGRDVFDRTTQAAVDWSAAMGGDAVSAAKALGRQLLDPEKGLARLERAGVRYTEQEKEKLAAMVATGDELGAQMILLDGIERKVKGSAEAQATGYDRAKVAAGNLAETVGGILAPAVEQAAGMAEAGAQWFQELSGVEQTATVAAAGGAYAWLRWGDELGGAIEVAKRGASTIGQIPSAMSAIGDVAATRGVSKGTAMFEVFKESAVGADSKAGKALATFAKYPTTLGTAAGGAAVLSLALIDMSEDSKRAARNAEDLLTISERLGGSLDDAFDQKLVNTIEQVAGGFDLGGSGDTFAREMENAGLSAKELRASLTGSDAEFDQFLESMVASGRVTDVFVGDLRDLRNAYEQSEEKKRGVIETSKVLGVAVDETTGEFIDNTDALNQMDDAGTEASSAMEDLAGYLDGVRNQADRAESAMRGFYDTTTSGITGQIEVERGLKALQEALAANVNNFDEVTEAGQENYETLIQSRDAAVDYAATLGNTEGPQAAVNAMEAYRLRLIDTLRDAGLTETQVFELIAQMGLTPTDIYTAFGSNAAGEKVVVQGYKGEIETTPSFWSTTFQAQTEEALREIALLREQIGTLGPSSIIPGIGGVQVTRVGGQHAPPRANGGPVNAGDWYRVNENGQEFFSPGRSGSIIPVGPGPAAAGGAMPPLLVQLVIDKRVLAEVMAEPIDAGLAERQRSGNLTLKIGKANLTGVF